MSQREHKRQKPKLSIWTGSILFLAIILPVLLYLANYVLARSLGERAVEAIGIGPLLIPFEASWNVYVVLFVATTLLYFARMCWRIWFPDQKTQKNPFRPYLEFSGLVSANLGTISVLGSFLAWTSSSVVSFGGLSGFWLLLFFFIPSALVGLVWGRIVYSLLARADARRVRGRLKKMRP